MSCKTTRRVVVILFALAGAVSIQAQTLYPTGDYPKFIISADLRHNGMADVITANYHGNSISVLLNDGSGFEGGVQYDVGPYPTGLAVGDVNNDGILDIVVANAVDPHTTCNNCGGQAVSVLLGNGDGTFQPGVFYPGPSGTAWVSVEDVNDDGNPDIVAADWQAGAISVFLGNGDGTFQPALTVVTGGVPHSLEIADYNRDGHLDIAVADMYSDNVVILLGDGKGVFVTDGSYTVGKIPHGMSKGDFNHDGIVDLVTANIDSSNVSVLIGNGDGTFQPAVNYASGPATCEVQMKDVDGDGVPDLVAANSNHFSPGLTEEATQPSGFISTVTVFDGNRDGTFKSPNSYSTGSGSNGIAIADFNGDGLLDVAVEHFAGYVTLLYGTGNGGFATEPPVR